MFKHGIRDDRPRILDDMLDSIDLLPLEFFMNPGCPPTLTVDEAKVTEVHSIEMAKGPVEGAIAEEQS